MRRITMSTRITHAAVYVRDLEKSKDFYCSYFNGHCNELYQNSKGFSSYFISFDDGTKLELMHHTQLEEVPVRDKITGWSHIAFSVGSQEAVTELTEKITAAGYQLYSPLRVTGDGYFESCVADPDGNRVEITV
jgi:lactoylglutathione lyase